jgi:pyruvate/2-oxoglutarate dehydrogenase complex dihydrolipoamide acyltransferase (E2) component
MPAAASVSAVPETRAVSDATGGNGAAETVEERLQRKSTPLVRKMAAEHKVDISAIAGSGLSGRVTKNDIISYIEGGQALPHRLPAFPLLLWSTPGPAIG